jgi:hypothetical protein
MALHHNSTQTFSLVDPNFIDAIPKALNFVNEEILGELKDFFKNVVANQNTKIELRPEDKIINNPGSEAVLKCFGLKFSPITLQWELYNDDAKTQEALYAIQVLSIYLNPIFHNLDYKKTVNTLKNEEIGTYLIRPSSDYDKLVIAFKSYGVRVNQVRVNILPVKGYMIDGEREYTSIEEVIEAHTDVLVKPLYAASI